jgi:hypothetical protein
VRDRRGRHTVGVRAGCGLPGTSRFRVPCARHEAALVTASDGRRRRTATSRTRARIRTPGRRRFGAAVLRMAKRPRECAAATPSAASTSVDRFRSRSGAEARCRQLSSARPCGAAGRRRNRAMAPWPPSLRRSCIRIGTCRDKREASGCRRASPALEQTSPAPARREQLRWRARTGVRSALFTRSRRSARIPHALLILP